MRYTGQSYESRCRSRSDYRAEFDRRHDSCTATPTRAAAIEVVNLRVKAIGVTEKPPLPREPLRESATAAPLARPRRPLRAAESHATALYRWRRSHAGAAAAGPAVITGGEATTVCRPNFTFRIDGFGNIIATGTFIGTEAQEGTTTVLAAAVV